MRRALISAVLAVGCCGSAVGCGGDDAAESLSSATPPAATPLAAETGYDYHRDSRPPNVVAFLDDLERVERERGWGPDTYLTAHRDGVAYTVNDGRLACGYLESGRTLADTVSLYSTGYGPTVYSPEAAATLIGSAQRHLCATP